jgi:gas vesicle protein
VAARRHWIGIGLMAIVIFILPIGAANAGSGSLDSLANAASPTIADANALTDTVSDTTSDVTDTVSDTTNDVTDTVSNTTNNVNDTVSDTTNNVTDTVSNTTNNVNDTVSDTTNNVTDTVSNTTNKVNDTVSDTTNNATDTVSDTTNDVSEASDGVTDTVSQTTDEVAGVASDKAGQASAAGHSAGEVINAGSNTDARSGSASGRATRPDTRRAADVKPTRLSSSPTRVVSLASAAGPADAATSLVVAMSTAGQSISLNVGACGNLHRGGDPVQCGGASGEGVLGLFLSVTGIALLFLLVLGAAFASSGTASLAIARRLSGASRPA